MRATVYVLLMSVVSSASGTLFTQDSEGVKSPIILIPGDGGRRENINAK